MSTIRNIRRIAAVVALVFAAAPALAQEGETPGPDEMKEKVREIERLMKEAEKALARSTDTRGTAETSEETARRIEKLLDERARESMGKSAEELRKLAEEGSESASKALEKLMEEAKSQSGAASEGVRKLLEETRKSGKGAGEGIQWILDNATGSGGGGGSGGHGGKTPPKDPNGGKKPKDPKESDKPPDPTADKPESNTEPPRSPDKERWLAELPPQVRRAYETQDWDSIPPKWRDILRAWTKKMADRLEKGRE